MKITLSGFLTWKLIFDIFEHPFSLECHVLVAFFFPLQELIEYSSIQKCLVSLDVTRSLAWLLGVCVAEGNCGELNLLQATGSETGQKLLPHSASGVIDKSNTGELQGFFLSEVEMPVFLTLLVRVRYFSAYSISLVGNILTSL